MTKNRFATPTNTVRVMMKPGSIPPIECFSNITTEVQARNAIRKISRAKIVSALWFTQNGKAKNIL